MKCEAEVVSLDLWYDEMDAFKMTLQHSRILFIYSMLIDKLPVHISSLLEMRNSRSEAMTRKWSVCMACSKRWEVRDQRPFTTLHSMYLSYDFDARYIYCADRFLDFAHWWREQLRCVSVWCNVYANASISIFSFCMALLAYDGFLEHLALHTWVHRGVNQAFQQALAVDTVFDCLAITQTITLG